MKANHPWRLQFGDREKLKKAKKEAALIYLKKRNREIENDKIYKAQDRENSRTRKRKKLGLPINLPVMKPWDFAKGRVKPST